MIKKIKVPASKSYMARALILASLRKGKTIIKNPLFCEDSNNLINALKNLGIKFEQKNDSQITVYGLGNRLKAPQKTLNIGNSGTAIRFLIPILLTQNFTSTITGNKQMQSRPMHDIINALPGIKSKNGCPPLTIHGNQNFKPKTIEINGSTSSQFISGLLMAKKLLGNPTIKIIGETVSKPYIDMTKDIIKNFRTPYTIETDASSASYFFALGSVKVLNISQKSLQADIKMLKFLKKMGYTINEDNEGIQTIAPKKLKPLGKVNLRDLPDSAMTLATLACFAEGKSTLTGLHNLRFKETNRLHALKTELTKIGAIVRELQIGDCIRNQSDNMGRSLRYRPDGLEITGTETHKPATIETYNDHRMAMCAAILKNRIKGIKILNPSCVKKTYPNFWKDFAKATS